jgi:hypothetical protein
MGGHLTDLKKYSCLPAMKDKKRLKKHERKLGNHFT